MDDMYLCKNCKHAEWDYLEFCNTRHTVSIVVGCNKDMEQPSGRGCEGYEEAE